MKSLQFTNTQVGTGFGWNTGSQRALKAAALRLRGGDSNLDNWWGRSCRKQKRAGSPKDDNEGTTSSSGDDDAATNTSVVGAGDKRILKQALDFLDSESLEKAQQKHSMLSRLRVWDEISSLLGHVDSVSRRFYHAIQGTPRSSGQFNGNDGCNRSNDAWTWRALEYSSTWSGRSSTESHSRNSCHPGCCNSCRQF